MTRSLPSASGKADEDFVIESAAVVRHLPASLLMALRRFRAGSESGGAFLVRGLIPAQIQFEDTPSALFQGERGEVARRAELCLIGIMSLFGEPFNFSTLYGGRLVQDVVPVVGQEEDQTSGSSRSFLDWHVEDGFSDQRCDYLGLFCLRGHADARTLFASVDDLPLDVREGPLRAPNFTLCPDQGHGGQQTQWRPPIPIISGHREDPEICFDAIYMRPRGDADEDAQRALRALPEQLFAIHRQHVMEVGDLLILDNRRTVHARTSFPPRYNRQDRWLLRTMVCSSIHEYRRRGGTRVIP